MPYALSSLQCNQHRCESQDSRREPISDPITIKCLDPLIPNLRDSLRACDTADMRLSIEEAKSIRQCVLRFDPKAEVYLFGSRADDTRRGGDIDLLIFSKRIGLRERLRLQSALEDALGLRKIDLVIVDNVDNSPFARSVQPGSVRL